MSGILIVLIVLAFFTIIAYNRFVLLRNTADKVFSTVDAIAKKRYDLIPNLVASVQKYMEHERATFNEITALRAQAMSGELPPDEKVEIDNKISKMMGGIMVSVENYPELKANQNFMQLQGSLNEVEEQLSAARRAYNAAVTDYNNAVHLFPSNVFAMIFGFKTRKLFEITEKERQNVDVKGLFNS
jgi:LemA protein